MTATWRDQPNRLVRGLVRGIAALGFTYVRLPFSAPRTCNICGHAGSFRPFGRYNVRPDAVCPACRSTERLRLLALYLQRGGWRSEGKDILHFAPEASIMALCKPGARRYVTADLYGKRVDVTWNIEDIDSPDESFDAVICSHVLEHVETERALAELHRILRVGGTALLMVPINEALERTYRNPEVTTEDGRYLYFHQPDHSSVLGRDFKDMVRAAGFALDEFSVVGEEVVRHGLLLGEKVFIATRTADA